MDPAVQGGQPLGMMPLQPGTVIMAPGQGPMVGQPVLGAPLPGQGAPMMMGGGIPMASSPKLEWHRPRVCAECDSECCTACWCPCISAKQIMGTAVMPQGAWPMMIGIIVFVQYVSDGTGRVTENDPDLRIVTSICQIINFLAGLTCAACLMSWKAKVGQHMNVNRDGQNPCEDFCCMWCCSCYAITAVGRTADDYARFARPGGGMMLGPGGMMGPGGGMVSPAGGGGVQPVIMMPAGGGMQQVPMQTVQQPVMMQPMGGQPGQQSTNYSVVN
ncbi:unnamed protein product [Amoebophrya sp. A25]|nr:unnamed protein product [Amoebophrya sp. A25]|eukprot:GSA25T00020918001.1